MRTRLRDWAAAIVANNWRLRRRLPRITAYAAAHGFITDAAKHGTILP